MTPTAPSTQAMRTITLLVSMLAVAGCEVNLNTEGLSARETRTFAVTGVPDITLETFDGAIEVHSWDRNEVEVTIEKRAMEQALLDGMRIEADQQGDRITLTVTGPDRRSRQGLTVGVHISPGARLMVAVPRKSTLRATSGDGAIDVEDIDGSLILRTADGRVGLDRVTGEIEVRTSDGRIELGQVAGRLDLETSDGSITIDGRPAAVRARTGDGAIRVRLDSGTVMTDPWDLSTSDGSITLTLPAEFAAEIDAETSDGSVRASHPAISVERGEDDNERRRRSLRTRMGAGGQTLKVRTGDGTIRFES
jgi:hypothetical protein